MDKYFHLKTWYQRKKNWKPLTIKDTEFAIQEVPTKIFPGPEDFKVSPVKHLRVNDNTTLTS